MNVDVLLRFLRHGVSDDSDESFVSGINMITPGSAISINIDDPSDYRVFAGVQIKISSVKFRIEILLQSN